MDNLSARVEFPELVKRNSCKYNSVIAIVIMAGWIYGMKYPIHIALMTPVPPTIRYVSLYRIDASRYNARLYFYVIIKKKQNNLVMLFLLSLDV